MRNRKIIYGIIFSLIALAAVLAAVIFYSHSEGLKVVFFDVGQGDAILISQGNSQILIDGGRDGKLLLEKLGRYVPFWDRQIEAVIATHPDQDHIGGLADVLRTYHVGEIIETNARSDSQTYKAWEEEIGKIGIEKIEAIKGLKINFSEGGYLETVFPFFAIGETDEQNSNAGSVVVKLAWGENSFLFTGDLPAEQEEELIRSRGDLKAAVLKVAHHGSKYSTSEKFLEAVEPYDAVISAGKNNRYGHPAPEVLEKLKAKGVKILRTDERGDIQYLCRLAKCELVAN